MEHAGTKAFQNGTLGLGMCIFGALCETVLYSTPVC